MILKQSTAYTRLFLMIQSSDHISALTGATCTVNVSKAGAAFGAAGGTVTEVANGWYKCALTTTDTNTLGDLAYHITATSGDATDFVDTVSVRLIDDAAFPATSGRSMVVDTSGLVDANAVKVGPTGSGTAQTARDIGANVLLSAGTGTGQLDFTSGVVKANLVQILGTALTETAGQLAAAFKQWFNVATPTGTVNSIPNAVAGATGGLFIAGTNAATTVTTALTTTFIGNLTGSVASVTGNVGGNVTGAVASVTGAVGSVTGAVGSVTGAVGSVTGNVGGNVVGSVASVTAGVTVTTNNDKTGYSLLAGQLFIKKNTGLNNFEFPLVLASDHVTLATGLTVAGQVSIDGAAFTNLTNAVAEIGSGVYKVNLAAADVNGTILMLKFTSATADTRLILIATQA